MVAVAIPTAALAQSFNGTYMTSNISEQTTEMEDGSAQVLSHYRFMTRANDPSYPLHNTGGECVGLIRVSAEGMTSGGSGSCFTTDGEGSGMTMWWQLTKVGTADCPNICGVWGTYDGYGRFEGTPASGTWSQEADIGKTDSGTWEGKLGM